jgi:hypothetical protein
MGVWIFIRRKMKIIVKNAVKRKPYWIYFITKSGDLDGYDLRKIMKNLKRNSLMESK